MASNRATRFPPALRALALAAAAALTQAPAAASAAPVKGKDPIVLPVPKSFDAGVAAIQRATGTKAKDLELGGKILLANEGRSFQMEGHLATRLVEGSHDAFLKAGLYLFRLERAFGIGGGSDIVALVATTDRDALIRRVGTSDPSKKQTTDQIVEWLAALEKDEPFALTEIGHDFIAGRFRATPKDPAAIAQRCAQIAPELVKGSVSAMDLLTEEIKTDRTLYLIW
jgi:hypothetical protein